MRPEFNLPVESSLALTSESGYTINMSGRLRFTLLPPAGALAFILWGLVFAISYAQSPLYTSNQDQYFLHGLANAGYGDLSQDWLANTADPTPAFSKLVELTYRILRWEWLFYGIYGLLMGVYFYSLWGIASWLYAQLAHPTFALLFIALLITVHSAGIRFFLSRVLGDNWTYVLEDGLADQRLLGPVLQPSGFGVFLLLSIYLFLQRKPVIAAVSAAIAAVFHPTYLLSAAVLTGTYVWMTLSQEKNWRKSLIAGSLGLLLVIPSLLSAYQLFAGSSVLITEQARQVLIHYRIPHHALVSWWFDVTAVLKIGLIVLAIWISKKKSMRLFWILVASFCTAVFLTFVQLATGSESLALIFPWRLSTYLVPLSMTILLAEAVSFLAGLLRHHSGLWLKALTILSYSLILLSILVGGARFYLDLQRHANDPERALEGYVASHRKPGETYLVPVKMQDFRLAAGASVYVDFKSIPYQSDEVLEWYHRVQLADQFYKSGDCGLLQEIQGTAPVTFLAAEKNESENRLSRTGAGLLRQQLQSVAYQAVISLDWYDNLGRFIPWTLSESNRPFNIQFSSTYV